MTTTRIDETEFNYRQQILALQVARLPILYRILLDVEKQVEEGLLGNAAMARDNFNNCAHRITDMTNQLCWQLEKKE